MDGPWTLAELTAKAASVLSDGSSPQPGGRVRDLPNERTIRWYVTIGLVDPPLSRRGRVAVYGPRHLLQLVAVKRRQAEGRSLADIQVELTGATDATLRGIARLDAENAGPVGSDEAAPRPGGNPSSPAPGPSASSPALGAAPPGASRPAPPGANRPTAAADRFWAERPAAPPEPPASRPERPVPPSERPVSPPVRPASPPGQPAGGSAASRTGEADALVRGVRLAPGVTLLLDASPSPDDAAAIVAAAAPLLDLLTERGLL